jgi:hypothetical protein
MSHLLCFIYKFRQRFAVVAHAIAQRMESDPAPLERYRPQMFLEDLTTWMEVEHTPRADQQGHAARGRDSLTDAVK